MRWHNSASKSHKGAREAWCIYNYLMLSLEWNSRGVLLIFWEKIPFFGCCFVCCLLGEDVFPTLPSTYKASTSCNYIARKDASQHEEGTRLWNLWDETPTHRLLSRRVNNFARCVRSALCVRYILLFWNISISHLFPQRRAFLLWCLKCCSLPENVYPSGHHSSSGLHSAKAFGLLRFYPLYFCSFCFPSSTSQATQKGEGKSISPTLIMRQAYAKSVGKRNREFGVWGNSSQLSIAGGGAMSKPCIRRTCKGLLWKQDSNPLHRKNTRIDDVLFSFDTFYVYLGVSGLSIRVSTEEFN